jgi:hypothetical protein
LRQAIQTANIDTQGTSNCVAGSGDDTIVFAGALANATIALGAGQELIVSAPLVINGSSQTISANHSRVMSVSGTTFAASHLTLTNGENAAGAGGGLNLDSATATLTDATIFNNKAQIGAGIFATATSTVTLVDSTVSGNTASVDGGGIEILGEGYLSLTHTDVTGNSSSARGGGVFLYILGGSSTFTATRSSISGNTAVGSTQSGGGVYGTGCASMTFVDSTIAGNTANHQGGGVLAHGCDVTMVNTTLTGNTSTVGSAGALYITNDTATLINTTISGNTAHDTGGIVIYDANLVMNNTIASANTSTYAPSVAVADLSINGTSSAGASFSLLGTALNASAFNGLANHNVFSDTPILGPLQNNGGPTLTMALLAGSPAIEAGSNALAQFAGQPLQYDQRAPAFLRRFNTKVDIGAFEYQGERIFAASFETSP